MTKDRAFQHLWERWMKIAAIDSPIRKQRILAYDAFSAGWEMAMDSIPRPDSDGQPTGAKP